jgi:hypothetical protein
MAKVIVLPEEGLAATATVTSAGAYDVADFLDRMIPTHCPKPDIAKWEQVRDALYAISNDTYAIVTEDEP